MTGGHTYSDLWTSLRELQDHRCGICGISSTDRDLVLDHDHDSGFVRGFLCRTCNHDEGFHGPNCGKNDCGVCTWRIRPAVAWLGWTLRNQPSNGYFGSNVREAPLLQSWLPTEPCKRCVSDLLRERAMAIYDAEGEPALQAAVKELERFIRGVDPHDQPRLTAIVRHIKGIGSGGADIIPIRAAS